MTGKSMTYRDTAYLKIQGYSHQQPPDLNSVYSQNNGCCFNTKIPINFQHFHPLFVNYKRWVNYLDIFENGIVQSILQLFIIFSLFIELYKIKALYV